MNNVLPVQVFHAKCCIHGYDNSLAAVDRSAQNHCNASQRYRKINWWREEREEKRKKKGFRLK